MVLTGSEDKTAQLWDTATGRPCGPPLQHLDIVRRALFSSDGKTVVTASNDKTARVWALPVPVEGTVKQTALWTKVLTGMQLDENGVVHVLDFQTWRQCRQELEVLGTPALP